MNELVHSIFAEHTGRRVVECRQFDGGQSDVFDVTTDDGGRFVLKIVRGDQTWRVRRERIAYGLLRPRLPEIVAIEPRDEYLLMRSAGGTNLARRFKRPGDLSELFRDMGRRLRAIHDAPLENLIRADRDELELARQEIAGTIRRDAAGRLNKAIIASSDADRWTELNQLIEEAIDSKATLCLLHGDYNTRQLVLDDASERVTAVVDFEYACLGSPLLDLLRMEMSGIRGRQWFYEGYGAEGIRRRHQPLFEALDELQEVISASR